MHRTTAADGAHAPVFDDLGAQHGQFQDLTALDDLVVEQHALAGAALGETWLFLHGLCYRLGVGSYQNL